MPDVTLEESWKIISGLIDYKEGKVDEPPVVPGMLISGQSLLAMHESRRRVTTWSQIYGDHISDIRRFIEHPNEEHESVEELRAKAQTTLEAMSRMMNQYADNIGLV